MPELSKKFPTMLVRLEDGNDQWLNIIAGDDQLQKGALVFCADQYANVMQIRIKAISVNDQGNLLCRANLLFTTYTTTCALSMLKSIKDLLIDGPATPYALYALPLPNDLRFHLLTTEDLDSIMSVLRRKASTELTNRYIILTEYVRDRDPQNRAEAIRLITDYLTLYIEQQQNDPVLAGMVPNQEPTDAQLIGQTLMNIFNAV